MASGFYMRTSIASLLCLHKAGLEPSLVGHHRLVPGRIEYEFDPDILNGRNNRDFFLCILNEYLSHSASRGGQCHIYVDGSLTISQRVDFTAINQSKVNDIDGNLRVINRF